MSELMIKEWPLPYEDRLAERPAAAIDLVVIHCTELPDMQVAREYGERIQHATTRTGNSGHYYIDRDGSLFRFVGDTRIAHHTFEFNLRSIGIELVNRGRYPNWNDSRHQAFSEPYSKAQIDALLALLRQLRSEHAGLRWIAGHDALDQRREPASDDPTILLRRRLDPGPTFPWDTVLAESGLERLAPG